MSLRTNIVDLIGDMDPDSNIDQAFIDSAAEDIKSFIDDIEDRLNTAINTISSVSCIADLDKIEDGLDALRELAAELY